jgi:hypothetical protein
MSFNAKMLCLLVNVFHRTGTTDEWVFVIGQLLHFLAMLAFFLELDSMNGGVEFACWKACWVFDASAVLVDEG